MIKTDTGDTVGGGLTNPQDEVLALLEECLNSEQYTARITCICEDGGQLVGKKAALKILKEQEDNGLMLVPIPVLGKQLRVWSGLSKTKMSSHTGLYNNIQWSKFESGEKLITKQAWTLLQLRLGVHPKYKLVLKNELDVE